MRLRSEGRGRDLVDHAGRQDGELCRGAHGRNVADLVAPDADGSAAGDEHVVAGEQDLVFVLEPARQEFLQPPLRQYLRDLAADAIRRQAEQTARLVVRQRDRVVAVGGDRAFVYTPPARLSLLEESRDLVRLEAERLTLQPRSE